MATRLENLVNECTSRTGCEGCSKKDKDCKEFKRILKGISEPWELKRLAEAFVGDEDESN